MHLVCETVELGKGVTVKCLVCKQQVGTILINVDTGKWYCPNCDNYMGEPNLGADAIDEIRSCVKEIAYYTTRITKILQQTEADLGVLGKHGD